METRLYRSRTNRVIAGVCGGLGDYLGIDPTLIRLFFVLLVLGKGAGILIYGVLWLVMPLAPWGAEAAGMAAELSDIPEAPRVPLSARNPQATMIIGIALILLGTLFLVEKLNIVWLGWLNFDLIWPLLLIAGGIALMWRRLRREA